MSVDNSKTKLQNINIVKIVVKLTLGCTVYLCEKIAVQFF